MTLPALEVEHAYRECAAITRAAAANFYYGIRLLPREKRLAMSAVYAFARLVDDIADGHAPDAEKLTALQHERERVALIAQDAGGSRRPPAQRGGDAISVALADAHRRFDIPLDALELLIEGVELDIHGTVYETFDELVVYCRDVAGTIGRLCLTIFTGGDHTAHAQLADDLGVAMQLTNILRDVVEDHANGRVYLPQEDLARFKTSVPELSSEFIRFQAQRAAEWFDHGLELLNHLDSRSAACVRAMTGIYRRILAQIQDDPTAILRGRISLPPHRKAIVAVTSLAAGARS